jgi:hypothetical protein
MRTWLAALIFCPTLSFAQAWHFDARAGAAFTQTSSYAVSGDKAALTWRGDFALRRSTGKAYEYGFGLTVQPLVTFVSARYAIAGRDLRYYFANPAFSFSGFVGGNTVTGKNSLGFGFGAGYCLVRETSRKEATIRSSTASYGFGAKGWLCSFYLREDYKVDRTVSVSAAIQPTYHSLKSEGKSGSDELNGYSVPLTVGLSFDL